MHAARNRSFSQNSAGGGSRAGGRSDRPGLAPLGNLDGSPFRVRTSQTYPFETTATYTLPATATAGQVLSATSLNIPFLGSIAPDLANAAADWAYFNGDQSWVEVTYAPFAGSTVTGGLVVGRLVSPTENISETPVNLRKNRLLYSGDAVEIKVGANTTKCFRVPLVNPYFKRLAVDPLPPGAVVVSPVNEWSAGTIAAVAATDFSGGSAELRFRIHIQFTQRGPPASPVGDSMIGAHESQPAVINEGKSAASAYLPVASENTDVNAVSNTLRLMQIPDTTSFALTNELLAAWQLHPYMTLQIAGFLLSVGVQDNDPAEVFVVFTYLNGTPNNAIPLDPLMPVGTVSTGLYKNFKSALTLAFSAAINPNNVPNAFYIQVNTEFATTGTSVTYEGSMNISLGDDPYAWDDYTPDQWRRHREDRDRAAGAPGKFDLCDIEDLHRLTIAPVPYLDDKGELRYGVPRKSGYWVPKKTDRYHYTPTERRLRANGRPHVRLDGESPDEVLYTSEDYQVVERKEPQQAPAQLSSSRAKSARSDAPAAAAAAKPAAAAPQLRVRDL